jgi:hypothetical protein
MAYSGVTHQDKIRQGFRCGLRQGQERRRETAVSALRVHAAAAQPGWQRPALPLQLPEQRIDGATFQPTTKYLRIEE